MNRFCDSLRLRKPRLGIYSSRSPGIFSNWQDVIVVEESTKSWERPPTAGRLVRLCQRTLDALPRLKQVGFGGDNDTCLLRGLTGVSRPETATRLQNVVCRV